MATRCGHFSQASARARNSASACNFSAGGKTGELKTSPRGEDVTFAAAVVALGGTGAGVEKIGFGAGAETGGAGGAGARGAGGGGDGGDGGGGVGATRAAAGATAVRAVALSGAAAGAAVVSVLGTGAASAASTSGPTLTNLLPSAFNSSRWAITASSKLV